MKKEINIGRLAMIITVAVLIVGFFVGAALAKSKAIYTFDPYTLKHESYDPKDCKRTGDTMFCKKAWLVFGSMEIVTPEQQLEQKTAQLHTNRTPEIANKPGDVIVTFDRRNCKFAPPRAKKAKFQQHDEWICKDVTFKWVQ